MSKEEEEAESRGFKVADRRRFVDRDDDTDAPASPASDDVVASESDPGESVASTAPEASPADAPPAPEAEGSAFGSDPGDAGAEEGGAGPFPEMTFSTFVISLMTQALMHLGEMVEEGHQPARDLPAAKQMIDLLGILREKTTGNLDANEEQLLGQMLYDLRMRFVEVSRGS